MQVVQLALFGLIGFYLFSVIIAYVNNRNDLSIKHRELQSIEEEFQQTEYKFTDPDFAYKILSQLETTDEADGNLGYQSKAKSTKPYLNLKTDDKYCDKRRAYFVEYPESIFEEMDFITDRAPKSLVRNKVLISIGHDIQPNIGALSNADQNLYDIKPTVTNFYTKLILFAEKKIGQHFSCLSQISNHLPGRQPLAVKDSFAESVVKYAERFEGRSQCFDIDKFFPKTFLLYQKQDCQDFFKTLNSPQYQAMKEEQKIVYMTKVGRGSHMGVGIDLITDKEEAELRNQYDNGNNCGKIDNKTLVQKYIHNPLLIEGHKFDLNAYMFVASINPFMAYYHDGYVKVSISEYDLESNDKKAFLSNIIVSQNIPSNDSEVEGLYQGMNEEELRHAQQWTFERLVEYLLKAGIVKDPDWVNNYLRPELKKAMIHLLRFGLVNPSLNSGVYQLYSVDFMLDADLNLWFIEANSAPGLDGFSQHVEKLIVKMVKDEIEIAMGLLRSRMKRVINYVNELIFTGSAREDENGNVTIKNFETTKVRFDAINQNYFEREFESSVLNGFAKIVDENLKGTQKYMGFVIQECL